MAPNLILKFLTQRELEQLASKKRSADVSFQLPYPFQLPDAPQAPELQSRGMKVEAHTVHEKTRSDHHVGLYGFALLM